MKKIFAISAIFSMLATVFSILDNYYIIEYNNVNRPQLGVYFVEFTFYLLFWIIALAVAITMYILKWKALTKAEKPKAGLRRKVFKTIGIAVVISIVCFYAYLFKIAVLDETVYFWIPLKMISAICGFCGAITYLIILNKNSKKAQ